MNKENQKITLDQILACKIEEANVELFFSEFFHPQQAILLNLCMK